MTNTTDKKTIITPVDVVFDIEADGLFDEATTVWCIVTKDLETKEVRKFGPDNLPGAIAYLETATSLIGHNIVEYDLPMLRKFCSFRPTPETAIIDTLVMSRVLWPDRPLPQNAIDGEKYTGVFAPHSLEAWGWRFNRKKPKHEDWSRFFLRHVTSVF